MQSLVRIRERRMEPSLPTLGTRDFWPSARIPRLRRRFGEERRSGRVVCQHQSIHWLICSDADPDLANACLRRRTYDVLAGLCANHQGGVISRQRLVPAHQRGIVAHIGPALNSGNRLRVQRGQTERSCVLGEELNMVCLPVAAALFEDVALQAFLRSLQRCPVRLAVIGRAPEDALGGLQKIVHCLFHIRSVFSAVPARERPFHRGESTE